MAKSGISCQFTRNNAPNATKHDTCCPMLRQIWPNTPRGGGTNLNWSQTWPNNEPNKRRKPSTGEKNTPCGARAPRPPTRPRPQTRNTPPKSKMTNGVQNQSGFLTPPSARANRCVVAPRNSSFFATTICHSIFHTICNPCVWAPFATPFVTPICHPDLSPRFATPFVTPFVTPSVTTLSRASPCPMGYPTSHAQRTWEGRRATNMHEQMHMLVFIAECDATYPARPGH